DAHLSNGPHAPTGRSSRRAFIEGSTGLHVRSALNEPVQILEPAASPQQAKAPHGPQTHYLPQSLRLLPGPPLRSAATARGSTQVGAEIQVRLPACVPPSALTAFAAWPTATSPANSRCSAPSYVRAHSPAVVPASAGALRSSGVAPACPGGSLPPPSAP